MQVRDGLGAVGIDLRQVIEDDLGHASLRGGNLLGITRSHGGAVCAADTGWQELAARSREPPGPRATPHRPGGHLHGARGGRPVRVGDLPQLHGRDRRLAERELGRVRQLHERLAGRQLPARGPQHAHLHARLAGRCPRRRRSSLELPRSRLPRQVVHPPARGPAVGGSRRSLDDRVAVPPRLALQRDQLDACPAPPRQRARLAVGRRAPRGGRAGPAPVAGPPEPRARRHHARARLADPPVRRRDLHRRPRIDPERGRGRGEDRRGDRGEEALVRRRPAAAPDRARGGPVRDRVHGRRLRGRLHPHPRRAVQLDAGAADLGLLRRDRRRLARRGRRDLAVPLPAARARLDRDALLRAPGAGDADDPTPEGNDVRRGRAVRDPPRVPLLLRARDDVQDEPRPRERASTPRTSTTTSRAASTGTSGTTPRPST